MAAPNPYTDGSYDAGAVPASQNAGTLAQLQQLAQTHPDILQDPGIQAAGSDPARLQTALQAWQHQHGMDPKGNYNDQGTLQNSSWFSDNLPWITALMGGAIGGAGLLAGGVAGGADAAGAGASELGPSTAENIAATGAAGAAPAGIAAGGLGATGAAGAGASALDALGPSTPANMAATSAVGAAPPGIAAGGTTAAGLNTASLLKNLGQVAGSDAQNAAKGRLAQATAQQNQDRNAIDLYNTSFQNNLKAPSTLTNQAARGSFLQNVQPMNISGLPSWISKPTMTGGPTPASLGPDARSAGAALSRNALLQLGKNQFNLPSAPSLTPLPNASPYDDIMSGVGRGASYASLIAGLLR